MKDVATSTAVMNLTSSCTELTMNTITLNTEPLWNSMKNGINLSTTGGTVLMTPNEKDYNLSSL